MGNKERKIITEKEILNFCISFFVNRKLGMYWVHFCKWKKMCFDYIQDLLCFLSVGGLANKHSDCNAHEEGTSRRSV